VLSSGSSDPAAQSILQFTNIFGSGPGQIPVGQTITSATLTLTAEGVTIGSAGDSATRFIKVYPMSQPVPNFGNNTGAPADLDFSGGGSYEVSYVARGWSSSTSWMRWGGGSVNNGNGPEAPFDYDDSAQITKPFTFPASFTSIPIDVTSIVSQWYTGTRTNNGFLLRPDDNGFTGVYLTSAQSNEARAAYRPMLTIDYQPAPEPSSIFGAGMLGLFILRRSRRLRAVD
jgi:hypothetical protein